MKYAKTLARSCIFRDKNPISIDRLMMTVEKNVGDFYFHSGDNLREIGDLQKKNMRMYYFFIRWRNVGGLQYPDRQQGAAIRNSP